MQQFDDFADSRLLVGCLYCSAVTDLSEEHAPSRVLLDRPLPDFPPKLQACKRCNRGYALDEEYFAAFLGCVLSGSTDPDRQRNERVAAILAHSPALRARIEASRSEANGVVTFMPEGERISRVVQKLAAGHAAYEHSIPQRSEPSALHWLPLSALSEEERESWDAPELFDLWPEVGSRGMQRAAIIQATLRTASGEQVAAGFVMNDWVTVQEGVYRYHVSSSTSAVRVRMTIREYLACEVIWDEALATGG